MLLTSVAPAAALTLPERPDGRINDYAGALSPAAKERLEAQLVGYEKNTTRQIAVVLFRSLEEESLEDVSIRLAERWKIGGKKNSDGVLLLVFVDDHKMRIEVGYGLEDKLTDALSARILREVIAPKFQSGDIEGGLAAGLAAIDTATGGEEHPEGRLPERRSGPVSVFLFFCFLFFILWLNFKFRRGRGMFLGTGSGWSSGGGGGSFSGGGGSFGGGGSSGSW